MSQKFAFEVDINESRVIQLPMEVPRGRALLMVVIPDAGSEESPSPAKAPAKAPEKTGNRTEK